MTDLDEELKRVRLQREKLALQEDERRAARRQHADSLAKTVVSTTREVGDRTLRVGAALAWCLVFGVAAAIAVLLLAAVGDLAGVGQDFGYRFGFYSQRYFAISALVLISAGVWCFFKYFRHRL